MNRAQRVVLIAAVLVVAATVLFPPYGQSIQDSSGRLDVNLGHHFIFSPPKLTDLGFDHITASIDKGMLVLQWMGIMLVAGGLIIALRTPEPPSGALPRRP